jgi:hypothetical protein
VGTRLAGNSPAGDSPTSDANRKAHTSSRKAAVIVRFKHDWNV